MMKFQLISGALALLFSSTNAAITVDFTSKGNAPIQIETLF